MTNGGKLLKMNILLKEENYLSYLSAVYPGEEFKKGKTIIGQKIGENFFYCIYIGRSFFVVTATSTATFDFYDSFKRDQSELLNLDIKENLFTFRILLTLKEKIEGQYTVTERKFKTSKLLLTDFNKKNTRDFMSRQRMKD